MDRWLQDLRFAVRLIRRQWTTSLVIVLVLGLGIAVNATIFLNYYAVELRPLPFERPDELVVLNSVQPKTGMTRGNLSLPNLADIEGLGGSFATLGYFTYEVFDVDPVALGHDARAERLEASRISASLFPLLGVQPALGRGFTEAEASPGGPPVAILGHELWQRSYGGDPAVLGRTVRVDGVVREIVGVMPEDFAFPVWHEVWVPLDLDAAEEPRDLRAFGAIARLDPGQPAASAQQALDGLALRLAEQYPDSNEGYGLTAAPLRSMWMPEEAQVFQLAQLGAVLFVLLIVCANAANLALAQKTARNQETAIRAALGASRPRLFWQHLTESAVLAFAGGILGILGSFWGLEWMFRRIPVSLPYWIRFEFEGVIVLYTVFLCGVSVLFFGTAPALRAATLDLFAAFKGGSRAVGGSDANRLRRWLVIGELALSGVLLVGALLMVKSFVMLQRVDKGYTSSDVASLRVSLGQEPGVTEDENRDLRLAYVDEALERLRALPGVAEVGVTSHLPASGNGFGTRFLRREVEAEGQIFEAREARPATNVHAVAGSYFASLAIDRQSGRSLRPTEMGRQASAEADEVVVISRGLEAQLWPEGSGLDRRLRWVDSEGSGPWLRVVGVVDDVAPGYQLVDSGRIPSTQIYRPLQAENPDAVTFTLKPRPEAEAEVLLGSAREALQRLDGKRPIFEVMTLERQLARVEWLPRWMGELFSIFALMALVIAAVGAYGVNAYAIGQRRREMGIRLALGAYPAQLVRQMMRGGLGVGLTGLVLGLLFAFPVAQGLSLLLFEVEATDPQVFGLVGALLFLVTLLSSWGPARKAAKVDPVTSLRED